jgi:hypothetical protein
MQMKIEAANKLCISGVMIWSLDQDSNSSSSLDDFLGIGTANGISAATAANLREQLNNATLAAEVASSCYWTLCGYVGSISIERVECLLIHIQGGLHLGRCDLADDM